MAGALDAALACKVAGELLQEYRDVPDMSGRSSTPVQRNDAEAVETAWEAGRPYDPVFEYPAPGPVTTDRLDELAERAEAAGAALSDWTLVAFARLLRRQAAWTKAVAEHDPERITQLSMSANGPVTPELVGNAQAVLESTHAGPSEGPYLDPRDVASLLEPLLDVAGATSWRLAVEPMVARMSVSSQSRRLRLNSSVEFTPSEVRRLAVHEIGCHVARSVAGEAQARPLLAVALGGAHLPTEEGLAVWLEERMGVLQDHDMRKYAARVLATNAALEGGFSHVYATVRPYLSAENAYSMARRVKRGLTDTSVPGGYIKDHAYLSGLHRVSSEVASDPSLLTCLSVGKVSFDMVESVRLDLANGQLQPGPCQTALAEKLLEAIDAQLASRGLVTAG